MLKQLEFDGARMSRDVFDGAAVEVHACDEYLKTLMAFPPRADMRYGVVEGMAEVFFAADVSKADAQRLATYLGNMLKGAPGPVTYKLAKRGGIIEVYMVVRPEALNDPAVIAGLRQDRNAIAVNVFRGAVVEMHLCDELMNEVRVLEP
jgi:hypothetical protein